jgi:hypothetical protein
MFIEIYQDGQRPTGRFSNEANHGFENAVEVDAAYLEDVVEIDFHGFCQWKQLPEKPFVVLVEMYQLSYTFKKKVFLIWTKTEKEAIALAESFLTEADKEFDAKFNGEAPVFKCWDVQNTPTQLLTDFYS